MNPRSTASLIRLLNSRPRIRKWIGGLLLASAVPGCSRHFWRKQADLDVYDAVAEKLVDPRWDVPRVDVAADPRSRFYDPYDLDRPPLPPDDPTAHAYMHWVDGWEGYKGWHQFGDTLSVENPQWLANFGITSDMVDPISGQYDSDHLPAIQKLTLQQAVELSQIHSRDYQSQIEDVYLAALDVTFERFQFGVRYLGSFGEPAAGLSSVVSPDGFSGNDGITGTSSFGISQVIPTGAQWMIELTNNTLWLFGGPNQTSTASLLSWSLTQPLWNGAGRKVILESLTLVERQLVYAIRDLARFRQQLFTDVVASSGSTSYLGLLQSRQQIINQQEYLRRLQQQALKLTAVSARGKELPSAALVDENGRIPDEPPPEIVIPPELQGLLFYFRNDRRLRWLPATEMTEAQAAQLQTLSDDPSFQAAARDLIRQVRVPVTSLDVLQILSQYNSAQNQLRNAERSFQDNLDAYKIQLGLPPTISVTLDESLLKQFELIDPALTELEQVVDIEFSEIYAESAPADLGILDVNVPPPIVDPSKVLDIAQQFSGMLLRVRESALELVRQEIKEVKTIIPHRLEGMPPDEQERLQIDVARDERLFDGIEVRLQTLEQQALEVEDALSAPRIAQDEVELRRSEIKDHQEELTRIVRGLSVIEVGLRTEMIELNEFDMTQEECLNYALENRVDLMNARAQVMDARRAVEVAANRLQAAMSLVAQGSFGNSSDTNPLDFSRDNTQVRFGVQFKAPLDQITERNNYRAALINYQRERRAYMLFEDGVKQQVRRALRGLLVQRRNLETARAAIRRSAQQYDAQNEQTDDPARAAQQGSSSGTGGLQVLNALNSILNAQNQLLSTWIDHERNRLNIYRDMGMMEIGPDGLWSDPFYSNVSNELSRPPLDEIAVPPADAAGDAADPDGNGLGSGLRIPAELDPAVLDEPE
jgi:hypothetical protein